MIKVGITGQPGFIGTHLANFLKTKSNDFILIPFEDRYFESNIVLKDFAVQCDVIVHLAALNRHNDPQVIYQTNIELVQKLIDVLEESNHRPLVIFSSSTQEEKDNVYGKSKKRGRELFINWADKNDAKFTGLIIPNVFGPFGNPFYNSVVATFCHQLIHNETPKIEVDNQLKLIYVSELVERIAEIIKEQKISEGYHINHTSEIKVSQILTLLKYYHLYYYNHGFIPELDTSFKLNLFNTFCCYIDTKDFYPVNLISHYDERGSFTEIIKLLSGGQISFSITKPGITRGNHFHTRKFERFTVIKGKANIQLRRIGTDEILNFEISGKKPAYVDMPIWYTHNITNIGNDDLFTIFWINEQYDPSEPDTYFEKV